MDSPPIIREIAKDPVLSKVCMYLVTVQFSISVVCHTMALFSILRKLLKHGKCAGPCDQTHTASGVLLATLSRDVWHSEQGMLVISTAGVPTLLTASRWAWHEVTV